MERKHNKYCRNQKNLRGKTMGISKMKYLKLKILHQPQKASSQYVSSSGINMWYGDNAINRQISYKIKNNLTAVELNTNRED